jgi:hypothetical protein
MSRWVWDARACAELVIVGPEVDRIKATLLRNARRRKPAAKPAAAMPEHGVLTMAGTNRECPTALRQRRSVPTY